MVKINKLKIVKKKSPVKVSVKGKALKIEKIKSPVKLSGKKHRFKRRR